MYALRMFPLMQQVLLFHWLIFFSGFEMVHQGSTQDSDSRSTSSPSQSIFLHPEGTREVSLGNDQEGYRRSNCSTEQP